PDLTGRSRPGKPWLNGAPRVVFVSDMSDALSANVPFEYLRQEIVEHVTSTSGSAHEWLWLSKRPERMAAFSAWLAERGVAWPANLWAGTSVTSQATTSRIRQLQRVGGEETTRFLSVEPQVERIDLRRWLPSIDWVVHGGESGRGARDFKLDWAREVLA